MSTDSFADVSHTSWQPTTAYQSIQTMIQQEVEQSLWANHAHIDGWCCRVTSSPLGVNNSWVTYTYQLKSDVTQTLSLIWPVNWSAPAENVNGELPSHFFTTTFTSRVISGDPETGTAQPLHETHAAPTTKPTYKVASICA